MKYNGFGGIKRLYYNSYIENAKQFLRLNIKIPHFIPRNSINYSQRLFLGEKFLLSNKTLYPYNYSPVSEQSSQSPVDISLQLETAIVEAAYLHRGDPKIVSQVSDKEKGFIEERITESIEVLGKIIKYSGEEADLPAAVYARLLYSRCMAKFAGIGCELINEEVFNKALGQYFQKIRFADSVSLSYVFCALVRNNIWDKELWRQQFERLEQVYFEHEFTQVTNNGPRLFVYRDLKKDESKVIDSNPYGRATFTYMSIKNAVKNNVAGAEEALDKLSKRVDKEFCEEAYVKWG